MKLRYKLGAVVLLVSGLLLWLHFKRPIKSVTVNGVLTTSSGLNLPPDYGHGYIVKQSSGPKKIVTITPKITGFPFDIGLSIAGGATNNPKLYLTTEIFYYRHFEVLTGLGITWTQKVQGALMMALGYRLPYKRFNNISLFIGADILEKDVIIGTYIRFGTN